MTIYYLYIKTHKITGLKYLGQTKNNPFNYTGSGVDWLKHLQVYGYQIDTEILLETSSKEERNYWGRYYSNKWHIVSAMDNFGNKIWANRIPETGGGAGTKGVYENRIPWNKGLKGVQKQTKEANEARRKRMLGRPSPNKGKFGELNSFYGKNHSEESKRKIKESIRKSNRVPCNKKLNVSDT